MKKNESEFLIIGKNYYYVLGDNRGNSMDSRSYGPVPRENILGKLID
ncbi:MAG: S26 family signal peptidase [Limisphaerales bacterium]